MIRAAHNNEIVILDESILVKSSVFALGLVLIEMCTLKPSA
jgi:hypothetical protein